MGCIYRNAILNAGSTTVQVSSGERKHGLFPDRDTAALVPSLVQVRRQNFASNYYASLEDSMYPAKDNELMLRGWVLQKRLLSRRPICFGAQMFWQCEETDACEVFPSGLLEKSSFPSISSYFRITTLMGALIRATITESLRTQGLMVVHYFTTSLCISRYFSESEQAVENGLITAGGSNNEVVSSTSDYFFERENINCFSDQTLYRRDFTPVSQGYGLPFTFNHFVWYQSWRVILHQFSFCAFTYQADYSPALSDLAQCFQPMLLDNYFAGSWGSHDRRRSDHEPREAGSDPRGRVLGDHLHVSSHLRESETIFRHDTCDIFTPGHQTPSKCSLSGSMSSIKPMKLYP